jgi:hypothetical protein
VDSDRIDDPRELDAFLDAVRWGAVTSTDSRALQAPFRSGIVIEDYQLEPVVRALRMPRTNLLIADDVGLGKTIEAGLVVQELILRHRARTVMVVCPASLQIQWRDEMREKFGLEFRIVNRQLLADLRRTRGVHANPFTHFPRLIVSIDWLKGDLGMRLMREVLPPSPEIPRRFDMLIVDEVHNVAPAGAGERYATDTLRTKAIRELAPNCEHRLFLSATPHNGYANSFAALLELLDPYRFARGVEPDPQTVREVTVRRLKHEMVHEDGTPRFPKPHVWRAHGLSADAYRELVGSLDIRCGPQTYRPRTRSGSASVSSASPSCAPRWPRVSRSPGTGSCSARHRHCSRSGRCRWSASASSSATASSWAAHAPRRFAVVANAPRSRPGSPPSPRTTSAGTPISAAESTSSRSSSAARRARCAAIFMRLGLGPDRARSHGARWKRSP